MIIFSEFRCHYIIYLYFNHFQPKKSFSISYILPSYSNTVHRPVLPLALSCTISSSWSFFHVFENIPRLLRVEAALEVSSFQHYRAPTSTNNIATQPSWRLSTSIPIRWSVWKPLSYKSLSRSWSSIRTQSKGIRIPIPLIIRTHIHTLT